MQINWSNLRLWVQFIQHCHWCLLSNPDWYGNMFKPSFIQHTSSEYSPFLAFAQLKTLVLKWQRSHFWLRALCSKTVHFQMSSAPWRRLKPTAPISSLEWQHCRTKTQLFTSSDCWHASGSLLCVQRIHLHICISSQDSQVRQSATYSLHQPQGNKEHGTERSGNLYKKSDG